MSLWLVCSGLIAAIPAFSWGQFGTSSLPLLRVGQGPRAAALGDAYIGLASDATALYWNPAGLGSIVGSELHFSHHQWFAGIKDELLHSTMRLGPGSLGISGVYSSEPGIERWSEHNELLYEFRTWNGVVSLGYGARLLRTWRIGLAAKGFYQDLHLVPGYGAGFDAGILGFPSRHLGIGLVARSLGAARWKTGWTTLPAELGVGASYRKHGWTLLADAVYPASGLPNEPGECAVRRLNLRFGAEYAPLGLLALRLGYRTGPADITTLGITGGLTAGLGVTLGDFGIDYCWAPYGNLGTTHRIGIRLNVPPSYTGQVRIRVLDRETMRPVWATLELSGILDQTSGTNRRGELKISGVPLGRLIIRTFVDGHVRRVDTLEVIGGHEQNAVIALARLEYGEIWAVLYDAETRTAIGGTVSYRGPVYGEQQVDPKLGSFALKSIPVGTYVLQASGPNLVYLPQTCTLEVAKGQVSEKEFYLARRSQ